MPSVVTPEHVTVDVDTAHELERFLYLEAELLDDWRLQDWLRLLTDECRYLIPATDSPGAEHPDREVFIVADSYAQILGRVERLESGSAFVESPRSRTRRLITNVRATMTAADGYRVDSNFVVYRSRRGTTHAFVGSYRHRIIRLPDGSLRIGERRAVLDCDELRPQGKISFIL